MYTEKQPQMDAEQNEADIHWKLKLKIEHSNLLITSNLAHRHPLVQSPPKPKDEPRKESLVWAGAEINRSLSDIFWLLSQQHCFPSTNQFPKLCQETIFKH